MQCRSEQGSDRSGLDVTRAQAAVIACGLLQKLGKM